MKSFNLKILSCFLVGFILFFINVSEVNASEYCSAGIDIEESYACDYSDGGTHGNTDYTILFVKHSSGYCSELSSMGVTISGTKVFGFDVGDSGEYDNDRRRITTFELDGIIEDTINNKSCPKLKAVITSKGFGSTGLKSAIFTKGTDVDKLSCGFSLNVAYWDSFCTVSDGTNFREVSKEDATQIIDDANLDREPVSLDKIVNWAQSNGYGNDVQLGDTCTAINPAFTNFLKLGFWIVCVGAIVIIVVLTAIGFVKAIVSSDEDSLKKAFLNLKTRIIVVIILLLLPTIINFIISLVNQEGEITIGDNGEIFCQIQ